MQKPEEGFDPSTSSGQAKLSPNGDAGVVAEYFYVHLCR
jgi:hypothetical protein